MRARRIVATAAAAGLIFSAGCMVATATSSDPCQKLYTANSIAALQKYVDCREDRQDAALKRIEDRLGATTPAPSQSPTPTPSATSSATQTPTPSPTPTPTPTATTAAPAAFPDATNTGVPAGTTLTAYTGPMTITTAGTVIDAKTITGDLVIRATGVKVTRSKFVNGSISIDENASGYSFAISDSTLDGGQRAATVVGARNFTATRLNVTGGNRSMHCWMDCTITDSWVHGQFKDFSGTYHESGIRMGARAVIRHNTIACDAPDVPPDAGCSAALTGYGDFAQVKDNLIEGNLIKAGSGGFCAYGGSSNGKPFPRADNIRFVGNTFERGTNTEANRRGCGYYGSVTGFEPETDSEFTNNRYPDGELVVPGGA